MSFHPEMTMEQYTEEEMRSMEHTAAGREFLSRRKMVRIDPDFIISLLSRGQVRQLERGSVLRYPEPLNLPPDAIVKDMHIDYAAMDFRATVISREFDVVPEGAIPPLANPVAWRWHSYELRRWNLHASRADAYEALKAAVDEVVNTRGDAESVERLRKAAEAMFQ